MAHIEGLEARMRRFDQALIQGLDAWWLQLILLQTISSRHITSRQVLHFIVALHI